MNLKEVIVNVVSLEKEMESQMLLKDAGISPGFVTTGNDGKNGLGTIGEAADSLSSL